VGEGIAVKNVWPGLAIHTDSPMSAARIAEVLVEHQRSGLCVKVPESLAWLKQLGVVAERSEVAVFVLRHHTRMIANHDGSVYSTRCSAAYAVYREDQWQRRSKHTELES
jgi:hypothetical protein